MWAHAFWPGAPEEREQRHLGDRLAAGRELQERGRAGGPGGGRPRRIRRLVEVPDAGGHRHEVGAAERAPVQHRRAPRRRRQLARRHSQHHEVRAPQLRIAPAPAGRGRRAAAHPHLVPPPAPPPACSGRRTGPPPGGGGSSLARRGPAPRAPPPGRAAAARRASPPRRNPSSGTPAGRYQQGQWFQYSGSVGQ
eukprot:563538-Prorocentrum_minimum.AAC.1